MFMFIIILICILICIFPFLSVCFAWICIYVYTRQVFEFTDLSEMRFGEREGNWEGEGGGWKRGEG